PDQATGVQEHEQARDQEPVGRDEDRDAERAGDPHPRARLVRALPLLARLSRRQTCPTPDATSLRERGAPARAPTARRVPQPARQSGQRSQSSLTRRGMGDEARAAADPAPAVPGAAGEAAAAAEGAPARPARSLSPSRAGDFLTCPLLYRFRVLDRLPEPPS